ncbi:MAG: hypothetical protein LPK21_00590, partial [Hymenobacteraceae bacterium]|nr:hypothetical protein [Hymenobacteraceae bacterium]
PLCGTESYKVPCAETGYSIALNQQLILGIAKPSPSPRLQSWEKGNSYEKQQVARCQNEEILSERSASLFLLDFLLTIYQEKSKRGGNEEFLQKLSIA